jgi:D-alanyl-D-alanine carboxypeptidase
MSQDDMRIIVPRALSHLIEERIVLDEPLIAPVVLGQTIGRLVIVFDKEELARIDLVAETSVAKLTLPRLIVRKLEDTVRRRQ